MFLFDRKFNSLEEKVERLEGRLSGVNEDLRALEDAACFKREWNYLIWFVLREARFSDGWDRFVIPLGRNVRISVGDLKGEVAEAGYEFSRFRLMSTKGVGEFLHKIRSGYSVVEFVDEDVVRAGGES